MEAQARWGIEYPDDVYPDPWGDSDGDQSGHSVRPLSTLNPSVGSCVSGVLLMTGIC